MSRAFVKDDAPDARVIVPQRAPLPPGTTNWVTPRGLALLQAEHAELTEERSRLQAEGGDEVERVQRLAVVHERLDALEERLASAEVVDPAEPPRGEVGFGARVVVRTLSGRFAGEESRFTIVGVDEAGDDDERVAFTAPIAAALLGRKLGEEVSLKTGNHDRVLKIVAIDYDGG